jgi:hypothetical protein
MKKILILGTLLVVFVFYNCKNKETQPAEIVVPEKTNANALEETDTTLQVSSIKKDVEIIESKVVTPTKNTTEIGKTTPAPAKVETTTKTVTKPIIEKKTEVTPNTPSVTKTETKTEVKIDPPIVTKTEPIVAEAPKTVDLNAWKVPSKYVP